MSHPEMHRFVTSTDTILKWHSSHINTNHLYGI